MSRSLLLIALFALSACDTSGEAPGAGDTSGTTAEDASLAPAPGSPDAAAPVGTDAPAGTDEPAQAAPPELVVGTNVTGKNTPVDFSVIEDGDPLRVELGFQGAYMVVLAFKAKGLPKGKVDVAASLVSSGTTLGAIKLKGKTPAAGGDGYHYYYNLFVITEGFEPWLGKPVTARITVSEPGGAPIVEASVTGPLTGG